MSKVIEFLADEREQVRRAVLRRLFWRKNPVLPPLRKRSNAFAWAHTTHVLLAAPPSAAVARHVLDERTDIELPEGVELCDGAGSLRRHARDRGGIVGRVMSACAEAYFDPDVKAPTPLQWAAWAALYPATAALGTAEADPLAAIKEWELIHSFEWRRLRDVILDNLAELMRERGIPQNFDLLNDPGEPESLMEAIGETAFAAAALGVPANDIDAALRLLEQMQVDPPSAMLQTATDDEWKYHSSLERARAVFDAAARHGGEEDLCI